MTAARAALLLVLAVPGACGEGAAPPPLPEAAPLDPATLPVVDARRSAGACPVHGEALGEDRIEIWYGLPYIDSPQYDSVACPYVGQAVIGGCGLPGTGAVPATLASPSPSR